jgi:hypothetical protein
LLWHKTCLHLECLGRFVEEELKLDDLNLLSIYGSEENENLQVIVELESVELCPKVGAWL